MADVIKIENLTKSYGKKRGVSDISLTVGGGEIFGFIGPNGAGKSTTIRSMLGFLNFEKGSITILGKDSVKEHVGVLKEVGYMPSEALFIPQCVRNRLVRESTSIWSTYGSTRTLSGSSPSVAGSSSLPHEMSKSTSESRSASMHA